MNIFQSIWPVLLFTAIAKAAVIGSGGVKSIHVDASNVIGQLKNLQGTNNAETDFTPSNLNDKIHDMDPAIANHWAESGVKTVLIYTWPETFSGAGKTGPAGDALNNDNYNWTIADSYIKFVTTYGAKASINTGPPTNITNEQLGHLAYMITNRYMNGAYGSGFYDALEMFDYGAERDLVANPSLDDYQISFDAFAAFTHGVAEASLKVLVGAWGGNRVWSVNAEYSLYDPYVSRFYADCKAQNVPIGAATFHFTDTAYSFDPYAIKLVTDQFRKEILVPAGFPDLPIWATESEPNPSGIIPVSATALADYNDPKFFSAFTLAVAMYAQDTSIDQVLPWTGYGYGGIGAGNAFFQPWFNKSSDGKVVPLNVAEAWKLAGQMVLRTPDRLQVEGVSENGFTSLAGRGQDQKEVRILLNNYQLNYDILREIANESIAYINTSTSATPLLQENGLLNGEQACWTAGNPRFFLPVCQTFPQATIRDSTATSYKLQVDNLPWSKHDTYDVQIERVGDGSVYQVYKSWSGKGNALDMTVPFPPNVQDLVTISKCSES